MKVSDILSEKNFPRLKTRFCIMQYGVNKTINAEVGLEISMGLIVLVFANAGFITCLMNHPIPHFSIDHRCYPAKFET